MALNKSTLSEQIYQILRSDILHQRIPLGEKLTLKNLQAQFEVSSTPIREALTRLTEDGLVRYYSNIGVNVIELSTQDLTELYQFMGDLDRLAILYSGKSSEQEQICKILEDNIHHTLELEEKAQQAPLSKEETEKWISYSICLRSFPIYMKRRRNLSIISDKCISRFLKHTKMEKLPKPVI